MSKLKTTKGEKPLDFNGIKLKLKTTYAGRKTETPLLSISKGGSVSFNKAFKEKFFRGHYKTVYIQVVSLKGTDYLLTSKTKQPHYYSISPIKTGGYTCRIQGLVAAFGKKGITMRYSLEKVATTNSSIQAFKITHVAEDLIVATEKHSFEINKNHVG